MIGYAPTRPKIGKLMSLGEHLKAAIQDQLKSGHTFRRNVQDIDSSERVSSHSQHGECLLFLLIPYVSRIQ